MTPRPLLIALAAVLALAGGCSSAPVTRSYLLSATAPAPAEMAAKPVAVVVKDLTLPQYLDRSQIVTRGSGHRILVVENELWAGNLHQDMLRVLVENLGRLLASERVVAGPNALRLQPDFRVEVDVLRFERGVDGRVELAARWWLTRGSEDLLLASPTQTLYGPPLGEGATYEALVASMSAVYGELAQAIARSIQAGAASRPRALGAS